MKCPVCNVALTMSERQGIEIDYCPTCRGVWLDRGELDKIIEKSASVSHSSRERQEQYGGHSGKHEHYEYKKHKRKSLLEELFD